MNLDDVLSSPEMELYFNDLPINIRQQLMKDEQKIHSANDLYVRAEYLMSNSQNQSN